jgi:hypothetical protein
MKVPTYQEWAEENAYSVRCAQEKADILGSVARAMKSAQHVPFSVGVWSDTMSVRVEVLDYLRAKGWNPRWDAAEANLFVDKSHTDRETE